MFPIGVIFIVLGHFIRIGAMFTARKSFHHMVQEKKASTHTLVTTGVYAYFRHPSYFGWTVWALGTQLVLGNPISLICYALAAYTFFKDRIPYEEFKLTEFFGQEYRDYAKHVPIRMPFIKSYFD